MSKSDISNCKETIKLIPIQNKILNNFIFYSFCRKWNNSKFAWTVIIFLGILFSIFLVLSSWYYNTQNPITTVADSVHNPIWKYRFPAVTICNINVVSLKKLNYFVDNIQNPIGYNKTYIKKLISYLILTLHFKYNSSYTKYYNDLQKLIDVNQLTVQGVMMAVRPHCNDLLKSCRLKGRILRCDSLFEETTSAHGLCCSTNYYGLKHRAFSGYFSERYKTKPRRMSSCGRQSGYKILINNQPEDYFLTSMPAYGVKVLIHDSYDFPSWGSIHEIIAMKDSAFINIIPELTYATDDLKSSKISNRHCVFEWETSLKYFNNYSHINCFMECLVDLFRDKCGCTPLFFWNLNSLEFNHSKNYACEIKAAPCTFSLKDTIVKILMGIKNNLEYNKNICKCLPKCENSIYKVETSKTILSRKHAINNNYFYQGVNCENYSLINIYFKDLISTRLRKDVNMNWYSELAWFGGLLGLCLGFSLTSAFEILYYLTIRFCINYVYSKKIRDIKIIKQNSIQPGNQLFLIQNNFKIHSLYNNSRYKETIPQLYGPHNVKNTNNYWYLP